MDIVATSRGNGLTALRKEKNTKLMVFPGGKIRDMAQAAVNTLSSLPPFQSTNTVYLFSGLPDTTQMLKKKFHMNSRKRFYEEVIVNSTAKNIHTHVLKIIKAAEKSIKKRKRHPHLLNNMPYEHQNLEQTQIIPPPHITPEPLHKIWPYAISSWRSYHPHQRIHP